MRSAVAICILSLLAGSCKPILERSFIGEEVIVYAIPESYLMSNEGVVCDDPEYYAPATDHFDHFPVKQVRVNFHFMNSTDSLNNLNGQEGIEYARALIYHANKKLENNRKMNLPKGNNTPVLPIPYRYHIQGDGNVEGDIGIYFHYDDEHYFFLNKGKDRNNYNMDLIRKYEVNSDSVLNIFYLNHHPDSIRSKTYTASGSGIALGNSIKLGVVHTDETKPWSYASLINHEVGHVFGLRHSWTGRDGCEDTPKHPNCWSGFGPPPCDGERSNNFMDYNPDQHAFTPCQLGKIEKMMSSDFKKKRELVVSRWCDRDEEYDLEITSDTSFSREIDLYGNVYIRAGSTLQVNCRLSMPSNSRIVVEPGARLILNDCRIHNACDYAWDGIQVQSRGEIKGEVLFYGQPILEDADHSYEFFYEP